MRRNGQIIGLLIVIVASAAWGEKVTNPEYESWSRFKPGATVTLESRSVASERVITSATTHKLLEKSAEKLLIETANTIKSAGQSMQSPVVTRDVAAKIEKAVVDRTDPARNPDVEQSEEIISINGKDYQCKVITFTHENAGTKGVAKTWTHPDVPGGIVKTEVRTTGAVESTTEQTLVEMSTGG